jgi:hypothetical protein
MFSCPLRQNHAFFLFCMFFIPVDTLKAFQKTEPDVKRSLSRDVTDDLATFALRQDRMFAPVTKVFEQSFAVKEIFT